MRNNSEREGRRRVCGVEEGGGGEVVGVWCGVVWCGAVVWCGVWCVVCGVWCGVVWERGEEEGGKGERRP